MHGQEPPNAALRWPLDALMARLLDPLFRTRFRRRLSFRETSQHANPLMLAVSQRDSCYVREWSRHAGTCPACRTLFAYFKLL